MPCEHCKDPDRAKLERGATEAEQVAEALTRAKAVEHDSLDTAKSILNSARKLL